MSEWKFGGKMKGTLEAGAADNRDNAGGGHVNEFRDRQIICVRLEFWWSFKADPASLLDESAS
jgi:hypothetical protein